MIHEIFAIPCVGAIIEKTENTEKYILVQTRQKEDGKETNGMLEIPAGKIREYEDIFSALRREVWEETGLKITKIHGEEKTVSNLVGDINTISFEPYCITQNLSGGYSIILNTFLCEAEGNVLKATNETENVHWMKQMELKEMLDKTPEKIFFMHINALKKYLNFPDH
jgi:8-oxo-dGTP pyrophosphatase MutT (NUDIX family)